MRVNLAGKKQDEHHLCQTKPKFGGESEYYLNLEVEDKKSYKEKSTFSNGELLSDPIISISLLLICL